MKQKTFYLALSTRVIVYVQDSFTVRPIENGVFLLTMASIFGINCIHIFTISYKSINKGSSSNVDTKKSITV
jgi:hypothetical protein